MMNTTGKHVRQIKVYFSKCSRNPCLAKKWVITTIRHQNGLHKMHQKVFCGGMPVDGDGK